MSPNHELHTNRLTLRPFSKVDALAVYKLSREETLRRRMPDQVYDTADEAADAIAFLKDKALAGELPYVLGVEIRETKELIGHVGLSPIPEGVEIGYAIGMAYQRKGYGAEAVAAFSAWAVRHFSLPGIWAILMADNEPSRRVLEKASYMFQWKHEKSAFSGTHLCLGYLYTREEKS